MTTQDAITEGLRLAGVRQVELSRRLGHEDATTVAAWRSGKRVPSAENYAAIFTALGLDFGRDADGWWVRKRSG